MRWPSNRTLASCLRDESSQTHLMTSPLGPWEEAPSEGLRSTDPTSGAHLPSQAGHHGRRHGPPGGRQSVGPGQPHPAGRKGKSLILRAPRHHSFPHFYQRWGEPHCMTSPAVEASQTASARWLRKDSGSLDSYMACAKARSCGRPPGGWKCWQLAEAN